MTEENQPKWREDFPIQWGEDTYITRREFTKFLVLASGAAVLGNSYFVAQRYRQQQEHFTSQQVAHLEDIPIGKVLLFQYPSKDDPAMLIRLSKDEYVAYKQRCTHLSCPVHFAVDKGILECPCHNGVFDARTGAVLEGPPPRPLPRITLRIENGTIFAEGVQGS